jgi:DNA-binding transcriptional regulator YiaG
MKLQNNLEEILLENSLSKYAFAAALGVDKSAVTRWCQNFWQPVSYERQICVLLKISLAELYYAIDQYGQKYHFIKTKKCG